MLYFHVGHSTEEWFECRRGIPTASCFDKIVTPTGKFSSQSEKYMYLLLSEILTGQPQSPFAPTYWMERGALMEQEAVEAYEFVTGYKTAHGGFITDNELRYGASPDRIVMDQDGNVIGGLEIKCPAPWTHTENLLAEKIDSTYKPQVQGQMLVCENLKFIDWFSYHPDIISSRITTPRDEEYIDTLRIGLNNFHEKMQEAQQRLIQLGAMEKMFDKKASLEGKFQSQRKD